LPKTFASKSISWIALGILIAEGARGSPTKTNALKSVATINRSNSLYNRQDGTEVASVDISVDTSYSLHSFSLAASLAAGQDLKSPEEAELSTFQTVVKKNRVALLNERIALSPSLIASWPVSKDQRLRQSLLLGTSVSLRVEPGPQVMPSARTSVAGTLSGTRNFHSYQQRTDGSVNTQSLLRAGLEASYQLSNKWTVSGSLQHLDAFSYFGGHREFYNHSEELTVETTTTTTLSIGHQLGAPFSPIRKSNGEDYNIQLTDDSQSIVYVALAVAF